MSAFKFNLGDRVKHRITGFEGIIVVQSHMINMCNRYTIEPEQVGADGKMLDSWSIDEQDLILLKAGVHAPIPAQQQDERVEVAGGGLPERMKR